MMKLETTFRFPKSTILLLFLFIFSIQSYANNNCGEINGFEFSNGSESMAIENGGVYNITDIPSNAFINLLVDGYSQSVRYAVRNDNTNEYDYITENVEPYTYPAGNRAWNLGTGTFTIRADLHRYNNGYGQRCDREMITFTVTETCNAFSGTATATMSNVSLVDGMATISATPNGDAVIPDGFTLGFVLTFGEELVIVDGDDISSFPVTEPGNYTIHPFVYNPNTLDVGIVEFGVTTGVDVLGLISQGGGDICASLDVAGAPVTVESCEADAGTLIANMDTACLVDGMATISATSNNDANIPDGYSSIYVLTQGDGLVIVNAGSEPSFDVTEDGNYTIHTLVYNADTLDLGIVEFGVTTGFDVFGLIIPGGGTICAALDVAGAPISVENPMAGTLTADMDMATLVDGAATISATPNGDINIPDGYSSIYVLTQGDDLVIVNAGVQPSFEVTEPGSYTIHTLVYNPNTLDLGIVELGVTTGVDVLGLISQGGGDICASLDVAGAPITVETCSADAGTLMANMNTTCLVDGMATISATSNNDAVIPDGYSSIFVLTQGDGLIIVNAGAEPSFDVTEGGNYTIHTLVYNPNTLDLGIVEFGVTTGFDVFGLIIPGGGTICAALDVAGAPVSVENPMAGTLTADMDMATLVDGAATISATPNGDINIPDGYSSIYVLTQGDDLVIVNAGAQPSFDVTEPGSYTIHTLVYNPNTLDLGIVEFGVTTGVDVLGLISQGGGDICASLDVAGAPVTVESCEADAGTLMANMDTACLVDGMATISATSNNDANIPDGYSSIYVLTQGDGLVIVNAGAEPSFDVTEDGNYTIHTLVYNPNTLDLGIVEFGVTTGFDVFGLIIPGGGNICAALDVAGAPISVENPMAGTLTADMDMATLVDGAATISATPNGDINIPDGYSSIYVLTQGDDLVIVNAGAQPSFDVTEPGSYTIHTLVYNPNTLDLGIVEFGVTTGVDVLGLIAQGGGDICASLDVAGAPISVMEESCTAEAGTMYSSSPITCLTSGMASIEAMQNRPAEIPDGYEQLFVLTEAFTLTILNVSATPSFDVSDRGFYRIHSLVYNPETLDLSIVVPGETTGFDVVNLINNNDICASLDVHGAVNLVLGYNWFCSFFNNYYHKDAGVQSADVDNYIKEYKSYKTFEADFIANNSEISLYPNPVKSTLNVSIQTFDNEVMTYKMRDMSGRQVATGLNNSLNNGSGQIDATNLANGMYIISFESEYRTIIKKVMVNK